MIEDFDKKYLKAFIRTRLALYAPGQRLRKIDRRLFDELIVNHPNSKVKIGSGVAEFRVEIHELNGLPCIIVERTDGSTIDLSWVSCVSGKPASEKSKLRGAMREAISEQVVTYKKQNLVSGATCAIGGETLTTANTHVDHETQFEDLAQAFLVTRKDIPAVFGDNPKTYEVMFRPEDVAFSRAWQDYHRKHAVLRLTCDKCNLSRKRTQAQK